MKRAQIEVNYNLSLTQEQLDKARKGDLVEIKIVGKLNRLGVDMDVGPLFGDMALRGYETELDVYVTESSISIVEDDK